MHPSATCSRVCLSRCLTSALFLLPLLLSCVAGAKSSKSQPKNVAEKTLTPQERASHALDRLAFGPRPGDVERVQAMGVKKWIDLQLNPQRIDDTSLETRLQNYPAMQLPLRSLLEQFPSAQIIRAAADGKLPLPQDRVEQAIYQNQIADLELRKEKQAQQQASQSDKDVPANSMALKDVASSPSMSVHEQKLYADLASTAIINLPADQRWKKLVGMTPVEFRSFMSDLSNEERLQLADGMTPQQKETVFALINPNLVVSGELLQTRLLSDIYSQRQLQAVMIDFWLNHFNVYIRKGPSAPAYLIDYERDAIAPNAMGKFEDLLVATAKSPAMLFYLDNHTSIGPHSMAAVRASMNPAGKNRELGLNENYARELMELHTLGADGGYTQKDVIAVAKVFTGWTIDDPRKGGGFTFNQRRHEPGPKKVLGRTIQENGEQEGLEVLHMLASSPATAHHLSQELAVRFVSDNPPPALVNRMAKTYLKSGGDIRKVLRTMFESPEFWSRDAYNAKVKTPEEFVISAVRSTNGDVVRPALLLNAIDRLGMPFYGCQTPNGYSWKAESWVNAGDLLDRMNISLALTAHRLGTVTNLDGLMEVNGPNGDPLAEKEAKLEGILLQAPLPPQTRDAVLRQFDRAPGAAVETAQPLNAHPAAPPAGVPRRAALVQMLDLAEPIAGPADKQAALIAGLLLGSPEFQKK